MSFYWTIAASTKQLCHLSLSPHVREERLNHLLRPRSQVNPTATSRASLRNRSTKRTRCTAISRSRLCYPRLRSERFSRSVFAPPTRGRWRRGASGVGPRFRQALHRYCSFGIVRFSTDPRRWKRDGSDNINPLIPNLRKVRAFWLKKVLARTAQPDLPRFKSELRKT